MKIVGWITVLLLGSIFARALFYFGYKLLSHEAFDLSDAVVAVFGLIALWACRVTFRVLISKQPKKT